uniref:photosystem I assembly protein Ycf4 n=1 Tax=Coursetia rostrata TaxID=168535 RepID=UPI0021FC0E3F|nr:photosystem I assembly protein Ycf4 [Coursetia rostrata]UXL86135.1 photosystem I assembly protein Ycf4 [Coursetia rostrata]
MFWISKDTLHTEEMRIDFVTGCRQPIDFFAATIFLFGGLGGLWVAAYSYDMKYLYDEPALISFLPQGVTLMVYSIMFLFLSISWWLLIFWNVGSGYDLFDIKTRTVIFFRYGFPGKNRRIFTKVLFDDIQAIIVQSKVGDSKEGKYLRGGVLYIQTREQGAFALSPIDDYWDSSKVAQKAMELCRILRVPIEVF